MKVLIVDDAVFMRKLLSDKLKKMGHKVIEAENGYDALEKNRLESPDVIFMDILMPDMDGITATRKLKEDNSGKVVICSVVCDSKRVIEAIKAGASDFVVKPFDDERIRKSLEIKDYFSRIDEDDYLNLWSKPVKN